MPELPEVETVVRGLRKRVEGRRIEQVELHQPLILRGDSLRFEHVVPGARIGGLERRGKFIVFHLDTKPRDAASWCLIAHLGMTGQLFCCPPDLPYEKHTHVTFWLDTGEQMRLRDPRRFGRLEMIPTTQLEPYFARLGPEPLEVSFPVFAKRLAGRRAPIKSLLLNQGLLRGLGNIYSDEALFAARIHPTTPAYRLGAAALRGLYAAIRRVLRGAIRSEGTSFSDYVTAEGRLGDFQYRLRVYGREGEPCHRCGARIRRIVLSGRSSHFCPRCQPAAASRRRRRRQRTNRPRGRVFRGSAVSHAAGLHPVRRPPSPPAPARQARGSRGQTAQTGSR